MYAALQYAPSFHLVEEWKSCEELKPQPEEKLIFVDKKRHDTKHRTERCVYTLQVSVHEMWKREQGHKGARTMYRIEILGQEFGKMK